MLFYARVDVCESEVLCVRGHRRKVKNQIQCRSLPGRIPYAVAPCLEPTAGQRPKVVKVVIVRIQLYAG